MEISTLDIFLSVVRLGSFAAAAREHGVAPSSVSRAVSGLEDELGARLFERTTRRLSPTEAGRRYFERVEPVLAELKAAGQRASDEAAQPRGRLRVSAGVSFAQLMILPWLGDFLARYPGLEVELMLTDRRVELLAERVDLAIRLGRLDDSSLVARRLGTMRYALVASPAYLAAHGAPRNPEEVAARECLVFPLPTYGPLWRFKDGQGRVTEVGVGGRCAVSNAVALRQCAEAGMGLAVLATWVVADALRQGTLVRLLPEWEVTATEFDAAAWVMVPSRAYMPSRVRVFIEALKDHLAILDPPLSPVGAGALGDDPIDAGGAA